MPLRRGTAALASTGPLVYENGMFTSRSTSRSRAFAGETLRALRSALLLLGLSGGRRAH